MSASDYCAECGHDRLTHLFGGCREAIGFGGGEVYLCPCDKFVPIVVHRWPVKS